jgi:hypothetical protein
MLMPTPRAVFRSEILAVDPARRSELERLSRDSDPETQAALDAFLDRHGRVVRRATCRNTVCTGGKNDLGDKYFRGSGYTAAWYVGLKGSGTPAAGDTMPSHATWSEITAYSQTARPTLTLVAFASGSSNTSASRATFTANASTTVYGYFLTSNNSKGGTTGILYSVANFGASQAVTSGQAVRAQVTLTFS